MYIQLITVLNMWRWQIQVLHVVNIEVFIIKSIIQFTLVAYNMEHSVYLSGESQ